MSAAKVNNMMSAPSMSSRERHAIETVDIIQAESSSALQKCREFAEQLPPALRNYYYGTAADSVIKNDCTRELIDLLFEFCRPGEIRAELQKPPPRGEEACSLVNSDNTKRIVEMERRIQRTFRTYGQLFPSSIWTCCSHCCFTRLVTDTHGFLVFDDVLRIHEVAEDLHKQIEKCNEQISARRVGVGGSGFVYSGVTREEKEEVLGTLSTARKRALRHLADFVIEVLPFLRGLCSSPSGFSKLPSPLCTEAICSLLAVSRNFLYKRPKGVKASRASDDEIMSLLDRSGVRMRALRRREDRTGYPAISDLPTFDCGCDTPCWSETSPGRLHCLYKEFAAISRSVRPRRREVQYLLNVMFCPLSNCSTKKCNLSLSMLYTVSVEFIADIRRVLDVMCQDPSIQDAEVIRSGVDVYSKNLKHPMNRYSDEVRNKIETHLDLILRADPGASDSVRTFRVYSPEINTHEKLRKAVARYLENDETVDVHLSSSTLQRMINDYLRSRKSRVQFLQSDHNACPHCKQLQYTLLQLSYEIKSLEAKRTSIEQTEMNMEEETGYQAICSDLESKRCQESFCLKEMERHNLRDAHIRKWLKKMIDHFTNVENTYKELGSAVPSAWRSRHDHAIITHQDDMTKVDLPNFVLNASAEITRWRYSVNGQVNAVNGDANVFSYEQGSGSKNAASVMELVLLDHVLRCRGEGIKIVVSDNASVGKNWVTTVAMPQYFVDNGLAEVFVHVFLENNHGKWLADQLFGQFQSRKARSTILGVDGMLKEFESINRKNGTVRGFVVNPLSTVDFNEVLTSLGYAVKPPKDFNFVRRNIHFAAACAPGARDRLQVEVKKFFGDLLPTDPGMVRLSSEPPRGKSQEELPFESRYMDVPAAAVSHRVSSVTPNCSNRTSTQPSPATFVNSCGYSESAPLIVKPQQPFAESGPCLVSHRNTHKVGYNGIEFRQMSACAELRRNDELYVREAWPSELLNQFDTNESSNVSESLKCAPENWVVRRPVSHFKGQFGEPASRYPPRNMLNAKFRRPPRCSDGWVPTPTYYEPSFPQMEGTSACFAMKSFEQTRTDVRSEPHVLEMLMFVYLHMGDRTNVQDRWLQHRATIPTAQAQSKYHRLLQLCKDRERGYPKPPITLRRAFTQDAQVVAEATRRLSEGSGTGFTLAKMKTKMFEEAERRPGALDRIKHVVEKDLERFANALKIFKEVTQKHFDDAHDLTPTVRTVENEL